MATSYQSKVASSSGKGTGASDATAAMISNLGSAAKAGVGAVGAVQSKVREVQKQRKADQLAKKAKKKEKKFDKKYNEEVFYDWREEFLHEVEKRGDKKEKKVIDVMRGKNQIEFNPVTEGKKDYCDCGCDCGKKICEECGKPHRPENIKEDMKGMSQKSGDKRPTDKGAGMTAKGVAKYNRRTGGNLKTAVTTPPSKLDPDSKAAKRRKSFCARSKGWTGERGKAARRRWNCSFEPEHGEMISEWDNQSAAEKIRRHAKADEDTAKKKVEAKYGRKTVARSGKNWKQFKKDVESAKGRLRPGEVRRYDKEKGKWVSNKD